VPSGRMLHGEKRQSVDGSIKNSWRQGEYRNKNELIEREGCWLLGGRNECGQVGGNEEVEENDERPSGR
jgi:hypothetical protein